ncbi:MAG: radical SAM family heme chaperone HemW [Holosporaceae bacterium]|nr:radical SAM family heme chaperone HemW [Holosporaceae bacterium]
MDEIAIYLHWPFCKSKCPYCDFASCSPRDTSLYEPFGNYLLEDLKRSIDVIGNRCIKSVFFGGGTPSLMNPKSIARILDFLSKNHRLEDDVEITLEANPATFNKNKMQNFQNAGINRLSLGIQSFSCNNLKFLGRIYDGTQAIKAADIVSKIFKNFSIDLMYGYKIQTLKDLKYDLMTSINFGCKHISCYQLTFEKNTPFYNQMLLGNIKKINEPEEIKRYNFIENILKNHHILRYEVSNYALPGFESKHNLAYWRYDDYLGVGSSAHSRLTINNSKNEMVKIYDPFLWKNALNQHKTTFSCVNVLTEKEKLEEIILLGLRLVNGITMDDLYAQISREVVDKIISKQKLKFLREKKLIMNENIRLTSDGFKKMDAVIEFLLNS